MVTRVKGIRLGPKGRGAKLGPRRPISISPTATKEEIPSWLPSDLPGERDYIPVLVMISGWRGLGKTLLMTELGLIQKARYQRFKDRLWYSHQHGQGWCNTNYEKTVALEVERKRCEKAGKEFAPHCGEHHEALRRHEDKWRLAANYPVEGADIVDPFIVDRLAMFDPSLRNMTVLVDELPSYFPNRKSLRSINVDFSTFIQQVRKRNIEMIFTAQRPNRVDVQIVEQIDWFIIPERVGPNGRYMKTYWFDYHGQYVGNGHKYWPPPKEEADVVEISGPLDAVYGKYPTDQVIAPQWSGFRDDIIAQDDWDESKFYDAPAANGKPMPEHIVVEANPRTEDVMNTPVQRPRNLNEYVDQLPQQVNIKQIWADAQPFLPKGATYKVLRVELRDRGYQVPDNGYTAARG